MFFQKKDQLVGLDIGSRSIKVGEIKDTSSGRSITRFGAIDIAPGIIVGRLQKEGILEYKWQNKLKRTFELSEKF